MIVSTNGAWKHTSREQDLRRDKNHRHARIEKPSERF